MLFIYVIQLHFQAIEEPANDRIRALNEVKAEIQADIDYFKVLYFPS